MPHKVSEIIGTTIAGSGSGITAAFTTNAEFYQILVIGIFGAIAYLLKSFDLKLYREDKLSSIKSVPYRVITPATVTMIVYYLGTDGFNVYIKDFGSPVWTFIGLLAALNADTVVNYAKTWVEKRSQG